MRAVRASGLTLRRHCWASVTPAFSCPPAHSPFRCPHAPPCPTQLLLVTPELLATPAFMAALRNAYVAGGLLLAAIDEVGRRPFCV